MSFLKKKRYYLFDWDDNILHMPTKIVLDKFVNNMWEKVNLSTDEFAKIRPHIPELYRFRDDSFYEFENDEYFINDVINSIVEKRFGPSFEKFKESLLYGHDFAIITARSHPSKVIKDAVKIIINENFTLREKRKINKFLGNETIEHYLDRQRYCGVSSKEFRDKFGFEKNIKSEDGKKMAVKDYIQEIILLNDKNLVISVGFSDDDKKYVSTIEELFKNDISLNHPNIKLIVYDTSNPKKIIKKKLYI